MVTRRSTKSNHLEEAVALLIQNQASFLSQMVEMNRVNAERFERIEKRLDHIQSILVQHARLLEALPETIREKIGFKPFQS